MRALRLMVAVASLLQIRCLVYGSILFPDRIQLALSSVLNKDCGSMPYDDRDRPPTARMLENPWLVQFRQPNSGLHYCHGTLITSRFVLTSAVCAQAVKPNRTRIILGEYDPSTDPDCDLQMDYCSPPIVERIAEETFIHPEFDEDAFHHDVALIKLNEDVVFSESIQPICLPLKAYDWDTVTMPNIYTPLWTASNQFVQHWMRYVPFKQCQDMIEELLTIHEGQVCAQQFSKQLVEVIGGSGSALQIEHLGRTFQIGILSVGINDEPPERAPYIYVKTSPHVPWIHRTILLAMAGHQQNTTVGE